MHKRNILVVEDNPVEQKIVSVLASRLGVDVDIAGTGYKALELLSGQTEYAAVFINYMLPAMNGIECVQQIRSLGPAVCNVPIIALTALSLEGTKRLLEQAVYDRAI
jgi:CheY-like chemotaxis protein